MIGLIRRSFNYMDVQVFTLYHYVSRSSGLAKTILQGTVQGGRKRGRQKKRWEDNIREWTGLLASNTKRKTEGRKSWRALVARSSVVPLRSSRLRDRQIDSTIVRPILDLYAQVVWSPWHLKYINEIENVQRRATKIVPHTLQLPYEERLIKALEFLLNELSATKWKPYSTLHNYRAFVGF